MRAAPAPSRRTRNSNVRCRRLDASRTIEEHLGCVYCFGTAGDIRAGDWRKFCDFEPAADPICFGFPPGRSRERA